MLGWDQPEIRGLSGFCDWNNLIGLQATRWIVLSHWIGRRMQRWTQLCATRYWNQYRRPGSSFTQQPILCFATIYKLWQTTSTHSQWKLFFQPVYCIIFSPLLLIWIIFTLSLSCCYLTQVNKKTLFYRHYYILVLLWCNQAETTGCEMSGGHPVS